jgi:Nuclease-related domain
MMGDLSEQWTAHALRGLRRRGWQLVNHFALGVDDIDHVVIGPSGAFAIETKWSSSSWQSHFGEQRQRQAIAQARRNARSLRLWHPFKSCQIPVQPVVVFWGRDKTWPAEHRVRVVEGVMVVVGDELRPWLANQKEGVLSAHQVEEGWAALNEHTLQRDAVDAANEPVPPSLGDWAARAGLAVAAAVAALFAFDAVFVGSHSAVVTVVTAGALAAAGMVPVRRRVVPWVWPAAWGWMTAHAVLSMALTAAEVVDRLHR